MAQVQSIRIRRYSRWDVHNALGLSHKVLAENHPCSSNIYTVDLSKVQPLPCRDKRGRLVRGIDMVNRFALYSDPRSCFVKQAYHRFVQWRMSPLFGTDPHIPLDAQFYLYCHDQKGILNDPAARTGHKNPHFKLVATLFSYPSWENPSIIDMYEGYGGVWRGMLSPANKLCGESDFALVVNV